MFHTKNKEIVDDEMAENVRRKLKKTRAEEKINDHSEDDDKDEKSERRYVIILALL